MSKRIIQESEMIINPDGSIFHLHLHPDQITDNIIVVGDPGRVDLVASFFDSKNFEVSSREFHTIGGTYQGKDIMCLSHGIGSDNIDIVLNELDALVNVDFETRTEKSELRQLSIVRIGTSGSIQPDIPVGSSVIANNGIGFDGVLNYYADRNKICNIEFENEFCEYVGWNPLCARPYVVKADEDLVKRIGQNDMIVGNTISAVGFYGPQGREIRLPLADPHLNKKIMKFRFHGNAVTNYEMECGALYGLSRLMGHKAMVVCSIIANRFNKSATANYKTAVRDLIGTVLDRF